MADQQPTVVKEEGDPLTTSHPPLPSAEQYAPVDDTELDEDSYIIIGDTNIDAYPCTTHLSTPCSVENGLQLKLDDQDLPFASFTYTLSPLTSKLAPLDWKLLVTTEEMESQNIRCHELKPQDNLPELIADFQKAHAVAVVLINTSDNYFLHPSFVTETQKSNFPVLLLTKSDGMALLRKVEQYEENVFAKISVDSVVDLPLLMNGTLQTESKPTHINSDQTAHKEQGYGQRFMQLFTLSEKHPTFNLKAEIKKLIFISGEPLVVCENSVTFANVMSTFTQHEKSVRPGSNHAEAALKKLNCHLAQTFVRDFPFYLVLAYKIYKNSALYQGEEMKLFIRSCIEKMESMDSQQAASTFLGFLQRNDFDVQFDSDIPPTSVFNLLQRACFQMAKTSHNIWQKKGSATKPFQHHQQFVYSRFMWVSLYLRLYVKCGIMTEDTENIWRCEVIKVIVQLPMDPGMVAEVKKGLEFGRQVDLPPNLAFSPLLLANLFVGEGYMRPFQQLRDCIHVLKFYISQEHDFFGFITHIRAVYDTWLRAEGQNNFSAVSIKGTLTDTLQEGLDFIDTVYKLCKANSFNSHLLDSECKKWVLLLLQLVDVTGDDPCTNLKVFLGKSTHTVVKEYREDIIKHVTRHTYAKFSQLTVEQFFPLYKAFVIWKGQFLENYFHQYKIPSGMKINDGIWRDLFSEVVKRFSGAQHHHYLLDLFQSVAKRYRDDGRAADLVLDLLKLQVPDLFAVDGGGEKDKEVRHKFSVFLHDYIRKCHLKHTILKKMNIILVVISDKWDGFQQLVLTVVQKETVPELKALQDEKSISSTVLQDMVAMLSQDLSWLQSLTAKQSFCWGIVASCCEKIPMQIESVHTYNFVITHLGHIYNSYCKGKNLSENECLPSAENLTHELAHSHSDDIRKYFHWVYRLQALLLEWNQKFKEQQVNYDEIVTYMSQHSQLKNLGQAICASSAIVDADYTQHVQKMFLNAFEQLNILLIKYIPGQPDAKWCTLPSLLQGWGVALPHNLLDLILQHVLFPGEEKKMKLLKNPLLPSINEKFQPGYDISLKLTGALTLCKLSVLVEELKAFLQPIVEFLDMLVFFKLYPSQIFDKYLQVYLMKESRPEVRREDNATTLPPFPQPCLKDHSALEVLPLCVLVKAMNHSQDLIMRLVQGTAKHSEIIAEGEINLENLNIEQEFNALHKFLAYLKTPMTSHEGLAGVQCMLELFQYIHLIRAIRSVCKQYHLQGCLKDVRYLELRRLKKELSLKENCAKLTPLDASKKMKNVKKTLCLDNMPFPHCLELFIAVKDSAAFFQFVYEKQFYGENGKDVFLQKYQLITAQLQHEEYDETVLNHLLAAYTIIEPFMDTHQSFHQLMSQVTNLDVTNGLKQLKTVNTNITLIRLWFSRTEGDTCKNVTKELNCIIMTGNYFFLAPNTISSEAELMLEYIPSAASQPPLLSPPPTSQPSSLTLEDPEALFSLDPYISLHRDSHETKTMNDDEQQWNSKQINDFVHKLGFLDAGEESGEEIKDFLHISEMVYKLLDLYNSLRELGHPQYIEPFMNKTFTKPPAKPSAKPASKLLGNPPVKPLACGVSRTEADQRVHETEMILNTWKERVAELRSQYDWLLFFSMPKLLRLYYLLQVKDPNLEAIVHEISFLCCNEQAALESTWKMVERSLRNCIQSDNTPMHLVGKFLQIVFTNHSLPKRCGQNLFLPSSVHSFPETTQLLHYCPGCSQAQLIHLIISIYDGVPESFEVFRCHSSSSKEELRLFLSRMAKHPLQYLMLEINQLSFKLQEYLIQEREAGTFWGTCIHFVETAPSVLREMPWVVLREHTMSDSSLNFERVRKICVASQFACVQLVYGHAGNGKTHYIQQQLADSSNSRTIAVNEAFTPWNAISKLRTLPLKQKNCAIFFNFTILFSGVDKNERICHQKLMKVIGWFFFDLLMLGYVEDSDTGLSFRIPGDLSWAIYVEVPSYDNSMTPDDTLKHFQQEVPVLALLGTPHYIKPDTPYFVDNEVQLVCKYLKAMHVGGRNGIDKLHERELVKFSSEPDLKEEECQQLLQQYMPDHVRSTKITQRLFIKYMKRRCGFLDCMPAYNFNTGAGEYITNKQGKQIITDTRKLGSTLMTTMLREVEDFCDPAIKENWSLKPHQQLIYDFKDGGGSLGLISLHPDQLPEEDKLKFKKIGVNIPSMNDLYTRELLDEYLSRALGVELENGRLTLIDDSDYVLTMDYTIKMLNIHERYQCGVPVIIEGETGVGKTALVKMLSKLWNQAILLEWKRKHNQLLDLMEKKLGVISTDVSDNYQACVEIVKALREGQHVQKEDLLLLEQLPDVTNAQFHHHFRCFLLHLKSDPVVTLLMLQESQQQETSLEELFETFEKEDSAESTASLLYGVLFAKIKPTFHKLNIHAAMTPDDIWNHLNLAFSQAKKIQDAFQNESKMAETHFLKVPFVTVFLDEVNTSSCLGLFKEIIVDRTFDGNPIPDNVFIVAACNPHRSNSLASHISQKETWVRGSYYVRQLHPTLNFLMWDYGSLDENQERDYINAKMKLLNRQMLNGQMLNKQMLNREMSNAEIASLTELIMTSQNLMRDYAFHQLCFVGLDENMAKLSSHSCVSQRDIQRVFTFYQWVMASYTLYQQHGEQQDYSRRAVLVALGIVYYMRLNSQYREMYKDKLDKEGRLPNEVSFSEAFSDELDWYINRIELPTGIAKTQALKENLFANIVCTVTHTPLIIVGTPGSSKTLSFNLVIANLKGQESKIWHFRDTTIFKSLDPHFYQCSRRTTSKEIQTVFNRAVNRQHSHSKFKLPIYCVVFMDEAGLPEESHESLKVLHYHLDRQEVSFVAITNHVLDAAKTNRAVSLFRPETSNKDLKTLAKGCLCTTPDRPPPQLKKDLETIVQFCPAYSELMTKPHFSQYFGLRDFIHFVNYLRRWLTNGQMITPQLVMEALERNFNGSDNFEEICKTFLCMMAESSVDQVKRRNILEVLKDSLEDRPQKHGRDMAEAEVRYKLIIDPSEDDSLMRLLFSFGVLKREETRMFVCSDFAGDSQLQKISTVAAIRHSAIEGHTVVMTQTDDIHESFYDLFNQRFHKIDDPQEGTRYYTNIAIGAHLKPSRVDPNFQCVVVIKTSEVKKTPAPFLNRFEKYCITHHSVLEVALSSLPPCIRIIVETTSKKVQDFIECVSGPSSLYGLQSETLDSLVLSLLPSLTHSYESLREPAVSHKHQKDPSMVDKSLKKPGQTDSNFELKVLLMQEMLRNLRHCAGFNIPPCCVNELHLDTDYIFELVLNDPKFEGLLPSLSNSEALQVVTEAMGEIYNAPAPQDKAAPMSLEGCLMLALLQQWLVRYLCKRLMQLMTSEAFILNRNVLPSSYLENYISFQAHFSLKKLILKYHQALEYSKGNIASSPTKLLCFTCTSSLIHQLPAQYPSSIHDAQTFSDAQQTLHNQVFSNPSQLVVCKLSSHISQNSIQELLREFVQSAKNQVCLLVVNMQETSRQVVNHLRIMIEEAEVLSAQQTKLFVMLLHFPLAQIFDHCYPSLFLKGWDHYYLDTVAHSEVPGMVDIREWLWQCCFPTQIPLPSEKDSVMVALKDILLKAISILSSRVFFGSSQDGSFNWPMNGSQRSKAVKELFFEKGVGRVLCERFRSYWKPAVMTEYLERAARFTEDHESMLNITDSVQTMFTSLFFDFLVCMLSQINEEFNIDILFDSDCTPAVQELFLDILRVIPLPKLSQLQILSTSIPAPTQDHSPKFPFFKVVCEAVERIVEHSHNKTNELLPRETDNTPLYIHDFSAIYNKLQEDVKETINGRIKPTSKESVVLAVEAMKVHPELWERYFNDFLLHKLQLGSLHGGAISQQILHVFFEQLHKEEALVRVVSLHCYVHIYHLNLAKMANILRPLNQIQQVAKAVPHLFSPMEKKEPCKLLRSAIDLTTQNPLGTTEHIATFVVNTLFNAILGSTYVPKEMVPEKMTVWFKAYRDVMTLPGVKKSVYEALEPQRSEGAEDGMGMEAVEARLNVMHAVFLAIQTSLSLGIDILYKGQHFFHLLFNKHFTETLEVIDMGGFERMKGQQYPCLAELIPVAADVLFTSCDIYSVRLFMEGLFAHFFSPYRRGYHTKDVQWFLELANKQEHWKTNLLECAQSVQVEHTSSSQIPQLPQEAISMSVFKLYLGHILGSCEQCVDKVAALSGPLQLYHHQPRSQVGCTLMATPHLGLPAPYIPTFYLRCPSITLRANHKSQCMQQPLAHLYFLTLLEHLQAQGHKLSALVRYANAIIQQCASPATREVESVLLWVELQAVVQVTLQELAIYLDPSKLRMEEVHLLKDDINRLLDDVETGGGDIQGHGMVLALHLVKHLKSYHKFSELLTKKYHAICDWLHCLRPFHEQITRFSEPRLHLFFFLLPKSEEEELCALHLHVKKVMLAVHRRTQKVECLVQIADECTQSVQTEGDSSPYPSMDSDAMSNKVDKRLCFRMMVWLCAYYDFYDKKVVSKLLCNVMENQLKFYIGEKGCIRLIQSFLNPELMLCCPEFPTQKRKDKKIDPIYQLFVPSDHQKMDQSDIDLRHSLANLVGAILGCPLQSNHLWYHLFEPAELHGTYMTGFMYDAKINPDGLLYDHGVNLSPEGLYGVQDYMKQTSRGTYTLHSLYFLLLANFGTFCMALLTQPEAEAAIHKSIISKRLSVRHYCVSQLRTVWKHMRENLGLLDEERTFLVMCCTKRLYELLNTGIIDMDYLQGTFSERQELDSYEQMWHTYIYQPSWSELKTEFSQYSQNKLFNNIRHLQLCYPHFPTEQEFIHSILSSGDIRNHVQRGNLFMLARFAQEWSLLQAGGLLLPDLLEFYRWLHIFLAHRVTKERAATLPIGSVMKLVVQKYSEKEGDLLQALYSRVKDGYNKYMKLVRDATWPCAALQRGNKIYPIGDDNPLLHFLSVEADEEEGNDCLYSVAADIITAHNAFIEGVYSSVQAQQLSPLARFLPDKPEKVYPSEVNDSSCIVRQFRSLHGVSDFLQLVRSRYKLSFASDTLMEPHAPSFYFNLLQEDFVTCFFAGKPLICTDLLRTPFKFRVVGPVVDVDNITKKLPDTFKVPLEENFQKRLEYEFHRASYHTMIEVVTSLRTVAGHLVKMENSSGDLEQWTVSQFMLKQYGGCKESREVLKEIGVHSTSSSQLACLVELPLCSLFSCLQLIDGWIRDGVYDFAELPFGLKTKLSSQDLLSIQQIPCKWKGNLCDLLEEIKKMTAVLKHAEAQITRTANVSAQTPIIQYLQENHFLEVKDHLSSYIPSSILIQHYVYFRIELKWLAHTVQQQVEANVGDVEKKQWSEVVEDLWDNLHHLRDWGYSDGAFVYDPHTRRYGFQEASEYDSEEDLMAKIDEEESFVSILEDQQPSLHAIEKSAQNYTTEHVGQFLEEIGLGHHVTTFLEQNVSGDMLLEPDQEMMLKELGVTSPTERLKIKVLFRRSLQGATALYSIQTVLNFLEQNKLDKYIDTFQQWAIDGDLLLEADDHVLKELGVYTALDRNRIKAKYKTFINFRPQ